MREPRVCARPNCGRTFTPVTPDHRYCSHTCQRNRKTRWPAIRAASVRVVKAYRVLALDEFRVRTDDGRG